MAVQHQNISDPFIHEPKGIETAEANSVYVANGSGTGNWTLLPEIDINLISTKIGSVVPFAGTSAPSKWAFCYGQELSRATYSALFTVLGTTFGTGNGTTTFNVPDLRGRTIAGNDAMGGIPANRLTSGGGIDGDSIGSVGGSESHMLSAAQVPQITGTLNSAGSHTHGLSSSSVLRQVGSSGGYCFISDVNQLQLYTLSTSSAGAHTHTVTVNPGTQTAHNNVQPTLILNYMIYHGVA